MAKNTTPTQNFIPIQEVRDGIVVLKNGEMRALLLVSALNMALKSGDEQEATIVQFQNFLNSLEFSTQMVIQSRRHDIKPYLLTLEERLEEQTEELLRVQTREYIEFIRWFTNSVNIMSKNFYVVVPYVPTGVSSLPVSKSATSLFSSFFSKKEIDTSKETLAHFEEARSQIEQRVAVISAGLSQMGLRAVQLETEQIVELFYNIFNPGETQRNIPNL